MARLRTGPWLLGAITTLALACDSGSSEDGSTPSSGTGDSGASADQGSATGGGTTTTAGGSSGGSTGASESGGAEAESGADGGRRDLGASGECDPRRQDCQEGDKCTAVDEGGVGFWNVNTCVPVMGSKVSGDTCNAFGARNSGLDDCGPGLICWDMDENNVGVCAPFCGPDDSCEGDTICAIQNDGVLPLCIDSCDPLAQDCPAGQGCYAKDGANGILVCLPDVSESYDGGADGIPCEFDNVCKPGLACMGGSAGCPSRWCCTPWCDLNELSNSCPGAGEECLPHFDGNAPPGQEHVGICTIPQ